MLLISAWSVAQSVYCCSNDGFVNIRSAANGKSRIVGRMLTDGSKARLIGRTGNWCQVSYQGVTGYVHRNYVVVNPAPGGMRKLYYVVNGSYDTFEAARQQVDNTPQDWLNPQVFKGTKDGKTVYRVCTDCCYTRAKAQGIIKNYEGFLMAEGIFWIWETDGPAECVYIPAGYSGEDTTPTIMSPQ